LNESIQNGQLDAAETGRQLADVKQEVQSAVQRCTEDMRRRSGGLVKGVLEKHAEQMANVSSIRGNGYEDMHVDESDYVYPRYDG
jgi:hypothetical protein